MGYKIELFVKNVDENLICPICKCVFKDPMICEDGHTFCKTCIGQELKKNGKCPVDGRVMHDQTLSRNFVLCGILDKLDVFCHIPDESKGEAIEDLGQKDAHQTCGWTGKLQLLAKHREICPFKQVQCPNKNCNTNIQRRELPNHEKVCKFQNVLCEKCQLGMVLHQLESHREDDCPETLIFCPNKCTDTQGISVRIKRSGIKTHLTSNCARTTMDCPYKDQGCSTQVERQHVDEHLQGNMAAHMMLLAKQCSSLTKENQVLKNALKTAKRNIKELEIEVLSRGRYVWKIRDFPSKAKKYTDGTWMRSPTFWLWGNSWFLKLYPNGEKMSKDFISLSLVLSDEDSLEEKPGKMFLVATSEVSASYVRITVKNQDQGKAITQDVTLNPRFDFPGVVREAAVINKLMKTTDALSPTFCNVTDGSFTVTCILF